MKHPSLLVSLPASVRGAAVASPGHPEPSEPPVSAGTDVRSSAVRSAQMAAVHPVQDGSGGDPVVGGCLAVLPHVTSALLSSRVRSGFSDQRALSPAEPTNQNSLTLMNMLCGIYLD